MDINTLPIRLIPCPFPFINITISMYKFSSSTTFIIFPLAFINRAIRPTLFTKSITLTHQPLSFINCTLVHLNGTKFGSLSTVNIIDCVLLYRLTVQTFPYWIRTYALIICLKFLSLLCLFRCVLIRRRCLFIIICNITI